MKVGVLDLELSVWLDRKTMFFRSENTILVGIEADVEQKVFPKLAYTKYLLEPVVVTLALTILTSSQSILIFWSKRAGNYEYSVTTANFLVEALKRALSLAALARIWWNEGVTDDNRLSTTLDEDTKY